MSTTEDTRTRQDTSFALSWRLERRGWREVARDVREGKPLQDILILLLEIAEQDSDAHALRTTPNQRPSQRLQIRREGHRFCRQDSSAVCPESVYHARRSTMNTPSKTVRIRTDTSGVLTRTLTDILASGEELHDRATMTASPDDLTAFRCAHRVWVLRCLRVLAVGFEPESTTEFLHVNAPVPETGTPALDARAASAALRDALELLRGLRSTLERDRGGSRGAGVDWGHADPVKVAACRD